MDNPPDEPSRTPRDETLRADSGPGDWVGPDPERGLRAPDPEGELSERALVASGVVAQLLEQSNREATANRAQVREMIRTMDRLRETQEYLGKALAGERRKSRVLTAALLLAPILLGGLVFGVWRQVDGVRQEFREQVAQIAGRDDDGVLDALREAQAQRVAGLSSAIDGAKDVASRSEAGRAAAREEIARLRAEWDGARTRTGDKERFLLERIAELERAAGALAGTERENRALVERLGAERRRADEYLKELQAARRPIPVRGPSGSAPPPVLGPNPDRTEPSIPDGAAADSSGPVSRTAPERPPTPSLALGASRNPSDLNHVRTTLNDLLARSGGGVLYRLDTLAGVSGRRLLGIVVSGTTREGAVVREIHADRAELTIDGEAGTVTIQFHDGHLAVAGRKAPFFDDRYGLVIDSAAEPWRDSGLTCLSFRR